MTKREKLTFKQISPDRIKERLAVGRKAIKTMFHRVAPSEAEVSRSLPGDDLIPDADIGVVINRAMVLDAPLEEVWPWVQQIGKRKLTRKDKTALKDGTITVGERAGWYLPASVERFIPKRGRGLREVDPSLQQLKEGDVIPDYAGFGKLVTARVFEIDQPSDLVFAGNRGKRKTPWTWALVLSEYEDGRTKLHMRIRTGQLKHSKLLPIVGGAFDLAVAAGFEQGLNERLAKDSDR